jgi:acyl carrier protein
MTENTNHLEEEIKTLIIESLDLEDVTVQEIDSEAPLFIEGLGLDSIDGLELGIALRKKYGISFSKNQAENKQHFRSVKALAEFIEETLKSKESGI